MNRKIAIISLILLLVLSACSQTEPEPTEIADAPPPVQTSRGDVSPNNSPTPHPSETPSSSTSSSTPTSEEPLLATATIVNDDMETSYQDVSTVAPIPTNTVAPTAVSLAPIATSETDYEYLLDPQRPYPGFDIAVLENNDRLKFLNVYANW